MRSLHLAVTSVTLTSPPANAQVQGTVTLQSRAEGPLQNGKNWGDVHVSLADPIVQGRAQLEEFGWEVRVLEGLNHMQAAQVVPLLRLWLGSSSSR